MAMRTRIVKIGNSQGIRIPKVLLEQSRMTDEVEVRDGQIVISSVARPRANWEEAFQHMARNGDDTLLDCDVPNQAESIRLST